MTLLLTPDEVARLLSMAEAIEVLRESYLAYGRGTAISRPRADAFAPGPEDGVYMLSSTDAIVPDTGIAAVRISSHMMSWRQGVGGRRRDKRVHGGGPLGLVLLFDTASGDLQALLHDRALSALRVGATSALAADALAVEGDVTVALIGCGTQAAGQLEGLAAVRTIREVRCYSPGVPRREAFAEEWSVRLGLRVRPCGTAEEAITGADIIACATNSLDPVVEASWLRPGVHVSTIRPTEMASEVVAAVDHVVVHSRDALPAQRVAVGLNVPERDAGSDVAAVLHDLPDLAELLTGDEEGRMSMHETTAFLNTIGLGLQFAALGALVLRRAERAGIGRELPAGWLERGVPVS